MTMQLLINMTIKVKRNKDTTLSLCSAIPLIEIKARMSLLLLTCEDAATREVNSHNLNNFCALSI